VVVFDLERMVGPMSVRRCHERAAIAREGACKFFACVLRFYAREEEMEARYILAGIDVHKKMLAVAVANAGDLELQFECRRFGTTVSELRHLAAWLQERAVREVVMESTAQYWRPVWLALEGQCRLHLAQARSNRGPRGRKTDFRDAQRAVSRLLSGDLVLSYVPDEEQRCWRTLTRTKYQLTRDKVRLQSQLESLLEECQIKLSSVVSDLLGASGQRILRAMAQGETDPARLAKLGDKRLRASDAELEDALSGQPEGIHRKLLSLYLTRLDLIESQMASLDKLIAEAMKAHQDAIVRLAELPGLGIDSAQQIIAEIGPQAAAFPSAAQLASWVEVFLDSRRVPEYLAVTARPKATVPCVAFSISSPTLRSGRKIANFRSFSAASPLVWVMRKQSGLLPTVSAG